MSLNADLLVKTGRFLSDDTSFSELVEWVSDHEQHWATLPFDSVARILSGTIMLASYEVDGGVRDPESVKELVAEAALQPAG